jgi:glycosyltransferase involved in cell wall biosynthesis
LIPRLADLPPPPPGRTGWPWTEETPLAPRDAECPRISVITPSFNQAAYLEETLRSVLLQGYPDFELIVVDGGSTDGSVALLEKYAPHLTAWASEPDRGQSDAINKGFRRATGAVLGWLNSDDAYFPGALQAIGRAARERPDAGLIYGAGAKIDPTGRVLKTIPFRPVDLRLLHTRFYILQPSSFVRRAALDAVGLLDADQHYVMDWDLALRIARRFPLHAIAEPIGMLRDYPGTKTRTSPDARWFEIVNTARTYNGPFDRNVIVFWLLYLLARARRSTGWSAFAALDRTARRILGRIWDESTYMAHSYSPSVRH